MSSSMRTRNATTVSSLEHYEIYAGERLYDGDAKIITILLFVYHLSINPEMTGPVRPLMLPSVKLK